MKGYRSVGICCNTCDNGIMKSLPEKILENGTVLHSGKCNSCGKIEKIGTKPWQTSRYTGVIRCDQCGYEYYYISLTEEMEEFLNEVSCFYVCPNCEINGFQTKVTEQYSPLKHRHGKYGIHPITQKHRGLEV